MKSSTRNLNILLILLCFLMAVYGAESDSYCLPTIKNSLDPLNNLFSWDFNEEGYICTRFDGVECGRYMEDIVTSLSLSHLGLEGQFPRCIENFTWLQTLDLSHNKLFGYIPSDISSKMPYLTLLDLSNNNFYGEIPKGIANLYYLNTLKLDGNKLTGQIPQELGLLPRLSVFSVANNLLTGPVPVFASNVDVKLSYANNKGLCGGILGSCDERLFYGSFWHSFIIGFVSSTISVIVAFMYYCVSWTKFKKKRRNKAIHPLRMKQKHQKDTGHVSELLPLALRVQGSKELSRLLERLVPSMSFIELCKATNYFSADNTLGLGTIGIMYKAKVPNNCFLAVKRLYDAEKHKKEFLFEAMIPGRYKHRNIAPLLGFCIEKNERILVYKYVSHGRLCDLLHPNEGQQIMKLEWPERIHIALGLARGLYWLHKKCNIVHLNLNSKCVLLDKNLEPKISNFGEAKFVNHTHEDHIRMKSVKKDVYDFGIILFELITGKGLTDSSDSVDGSLMNYISNNLFTDPIELYDAVDKFIIGKGFDDKILRLLEVACDCVMASLEQRPKMVDLYKTIKAMWEGYKTFSHDEIECIC